MTLSLLAVFLGLIRSVQGPPADMVIKAFVAAAKPLVIKVLTKYARFKAQPFRDSHAKIRPKIFSAVRLSFRVISIEDILSNVYSYIRPTVVF